MAQLMQHVLLRLDNLTSSMQMQQEAVAVQLTAVQQQQQTTQALASRLGAVEAAAWATRSPASSSHPGAAGAPPSQAVAPPAPSYALPNVGSAHSATSTSNPANQAKQLTTLLLNGGVTPSCLRTKSHGNQFYDLLSAEFCIRRGTTRSVLPRFSEEEMRWLDYPNPTQVNCVVNKAILQAIQYGLFGSHFGIAHIKFTSGTSSSVLDLSADDKTELEATQVLLYGPAGGPLSAAPTYSGLPAATCPAIPLTTMWELRERLATLIRICLLFFPHSKNPPPLLEGEAPFTASYTLTQGLCLVSDALEQLTSRGHLPVALAADIATSIDQAAKAYCEVLHTEAGELQEDFLTMPPAKVVQARAALGRALRTAFTPVMRQLLGTDTTLYSKYGLLGSSLSGSAGFSPSSASSSSSSSDLATGGFPSGLFLQGLDGQAICVNHVIHRKCVHQKCKYSHSLKALSAKNLAQLQANVATHGNATHKAHFQISLQEFRSAAPSPAPSASSPPAGASPGGSQA